MNLVLIPQGPLPEIDIVDLKVLVSCWMLQDLIKLWISLSLKITAFVHTTLGTFVCIIVMVLDDQLTDELMRVMPM